MAISATAPTDSAGRRYHIGLKEGDLAERILLVGDPNRAERVAKRFDKVRGEHRHREFVTFTGTYRGTEISVMGTGIGPDNTEIAVIESCLITKNPTFIRSGSSSALQPEMRRGDLIVSKGALRLENTSDFFVHDKYPAVASPDVVLALAAACASLKARFHVGLTASAPGFYGAQGRATEGFPIRYPNLADDLARQGVANFEMESSLLFVLAELRRVRAGAVCAAYGDRSKDSFGGDKDLAQAESRCIDAALRAFTILRKMDAERARRKLPVWVPPKWSRR